MIEIGFHTDAFNSSYWSFEQCLQWAEKNDVHYIECGTIDGVSWLEGLGYQPHVSLTTDPMVLRKKMEKYGVKFSQLDAAFPVSLPAGASYGLIYILNTIRWANAVSGNWNDPANWMPQQVPGVADKALIDLPGVFTVTVSSSARVQAGAVYTAAFTPDGRDIVLGRRDGYVHLVDAGNLEPVGEGELPKGVTDINTLWVEENEAETEAEAVAD